MSLHPLPWHIRLLELHVSLTRLIRDNHLIRQHDPNLRLFPARQTPPIRNRIISRRRIVGRLNLHRADLRLNVDWSLPLLWRKVFLTRVLHHGLYEISGRVCGIASFAWRGADLADVTSGVAVVAVVVVCWTRFLGAGGFAAAAKGVSTMEEFVHQW